MNRRRGVSFSKGTAKNKKYTFRRLWNYLFKFRVLLILSLILTICSNLLALLGPKLTGLIMDEIDKGAGNVDFNNIYYYYENGQLLIYGIGENSVTTRLEIIEQLACLGIKLDVLG